MAALVAVAIATVIALNLARVGFPLPPSGRRIGCVDGLRGYLALSVVAHHFVVWVQVDRMGLQWAPPSINLLNQLGAGAVALFFMTTGLVFYPIVLAGFRSTSWVAVYTSRAFRILPLVVVSVLIISAIIVLRTGVAPDRHYVPAVMRWLTSWSEPPLLGYPDSGRVNAYVLWSLWFEWVFYLLLLPLCALAMDAVRVAGRPTWVVPLGLLLAATIGRLIVGRLGIHSAAIDRIGLQYLPLFSVGMFAYEIQGRERMRKMLRRPVFSAVGAIALILGMTVAPFPYGFALPLFAIFFMCVACGNDFWGILTTRGALVLGECSFSIYLLHGILLDVLFVDLRAFEARNVAILLPVVAVAVTLVASASYLAVERPAIRAGKSIVRVFERARGTRVVRSSSAS